MEKEARSLIARAAILVLLGTLLIGPVAGLESSQPYSTKQFLADAGVNPLFAAKKAIETNNRELIHQLDFTTIDAHDSEQILDLAMGPTFPGNKIADAIESGAILKMDTWKRLTDTQLSYPLPGGGTIRDKVPDLTILSADSRDESIKTDAGILPDDRLITYPTPGATTSTADGRVTISDLDSIELSTQALRIIGTNLTGTAISRDSFFARNAELLTIHAPASIPLTRQPVHPEIGTPTEEGRSILITNASEVFLDPSGNLSIADAQAIQASIPSPPGRPVKDEDRTSPSSGAAAPKRYDITGIGVPDTRPKSQPASMITLSGITQATLTFDGIWASKVRTNRTPTTFGVSSLTAARASRADLLGISIKGATGMELLPGKRSLRLDQAAELDRGPLRFHSLRTAAIDLSNGFSLRLPPDTTIPLAILKATASYHTLSPDNLLSLAQARPTGNRSEAVRVTFNAGRLAITRSGTIETIEAGNETIATITDDGFECAASKPLSTYTYHPGTTDQAFSIVTFVTPQTVCVIRQDGKPPTPPCSESCTLIDIPAGRIISDGIIDYQRFPKGVAGGPDRGEALMTSRVTAYHGATMVMQHDPGFKNLLNTTAIGGEFIVYRPNNYLKIIDQEGHRLIQRDNHLAPAAISDTDIQAIEGHSGPPIVATATYAIQQTPTGRGIYILYPGNPQIGQLITQADARLLRYTP